MVSCREADDTRIPLAPVRIDMGMQSMWVTYGVNGVGSYRYFDMQRGLPAKFPYSETSATGFGGVLLMADGMGQPVAFDLACPYERTKTVRVAIDAGNLDAVCPSCESHYNVLTGYGTPLSGPALTAGYQLRRYNVMSSVYGGYIITN